MSKSHAPPVTHRPSWDALFLVCKACRKRSDGPKEGKAKEMAVELRRGARGEGVRARVLLTTCQGLCPKRATAVTWVRRDNGPVVVAVASVAQAGEVAKLSVT